MRINKSSRVVLARASASYIAIINPRRRACAARGTVLGMSVRAAPPPRARHQRVQRLSCCPLCPTYIVQHLPFPLLLPFNTSLFPSPSSSPFFFSLSLYFHPFSLPFHLSPCLPPSLLFPHSLLLPSSLPPRRTQPLRAPDCSCSSQLSQGSRLPPFEGRHSQRHKERQHSTISRWKSESKTINYWKTCSIIGDLNYALFIDGTCHHTSM